MALSADGVTRYTTSSRYGLTGAGGNDIAPRRRKTRFTTNLFLLSYLDRIVPKSAPQTLKSD